ncbi:HtrA protease/chaperone protein [Myxococcus hansupus]|uniref:HtrA protease/chaperone protein n=1 Tax=Pseudomyxococcus hansupus TaxID=1297742 RepID=A0A0H4WPS2_9BACT|nr:trypsin-like peptidase domain-containing protein [Myxococcus hansupus]AKQ63330.1 HtrA protease/chaperone protein [Myxococcus hansupus]
MTGRARGLAVGVLLGLVACRRDAEETPPESVPYTEQAPSSSEPSGPALPPGRALALASVAPLVASVSPAVVNVEVRIGASAREEGEDTPWGGGGASPFGDSPQDDGTPWGGDGPSPFGGAPQDEDAPRGGGGPSPFLGAPRGGGGASPFLGAPRNGGGASPFLGAPGDDSPFGGSPFDGSPFGGSPFDDAPPSPFKDSVPFAPPVREGIGSGFIIDATGRVLTNHHLVADAEEIQVQLADGRDLEARVLGSDPLTDVAILQLELPKGAKALPVVRMGDSDALRVGDWVVAIGNPFGLASSTSLGILSAKERNIEAGPFDDFLQTDAAINPGNSGGPLFNLRGEVVGINTAIAGEGSSIGFAVPSNLVKSLLPQLEKKGSVSRGWLGLLVQDMTPDLGEALGAPVREGAVVTDVTRETAAARAGLQQDDVIVSVDGQPVDSARALTRWVAMKAPGSELSLTLYRDAKKHDVKATLGKRPDLEGVAANKPPDDAKRPAEHRVGLSVMDMDPRLAESEELPETGALVTEVAPASMAEHAGMLPGMVVVEAANQPVRGAQDVVRALRKTKPGQRVLLRVALPGGGRELRALTVPEK